MKEAEKKICPFMSQRAFDSSYIPAKDYLSCTLCKTDQCMAWKTHSTTNGRGDFQGYCKLMEDNHNGSTI